VKAWGRYLRYNYSKFDFSEVREPGLYVIAYKNKRSNPIRIAEDVFEKAWHPTLDIFFPVQMDHMHVNEAYRVWHGASHLDDALQAPVDHVHFDLYAQGPTTDTPYNPGEHIPGLNIGGWYDAGDYDIRTQTHYATVLDLVQVWERFRPQRDNTTVDQQTRYVDIHVPDGKPDLLQQIEHGTLQLIAQHRALGRAIPGIVEAHLSQYTHLGDGMTKTDNLIYNPNLDSLESDGFTSGTFDDRWAFTSKTTPLNYGSIAALAAASRALRGYNDELAAECLATAIKVWDYEQSKEPDIFYHGNTTGGPLDEEELKATVELLIATREGKYAKRINQMWPVFEKKFNATAALAVRAMPFMDKKFVKRLEGLVKTYASNLDRHDKANPFGVPISTGGWAGNGLIMRFAINNYLLHKAFPHLIDQEYVYRSLNYLFGCHPGSNISFVSAVGVESKKVAYGMNRADFSFIAGGIVPGVLVLKPDFPENKEDWPFLWGQNEYVINMGAAYIFLVHAVNDLLNGEGAPGN
jgi:endoglucanase